MNPLVAPEASAPAHAGRTALSVNVNKIALLRNTRHIGIPDVVALSRLILESGAQGITVHPRPDERHIRASDVQAIAELMRAWPQAEYNIEGNPFHNLMDFVRALAPLGLPHQATFVPDGVDQFTSDHGWRFPDDHDRLKPLIDECHALGVRVSLFMDPDAQQMAGAARTGADRVELYTEAYASSHGKPEGPAVLARYAAAAEAALAAGLGLNAGHDLNRDNLTTFLAGVPGVAEVSIGHALVADALALGLPETVREYQRCIQRAGAASAAGRPGGAA